jgi:hypothetical protein
MSGGKDYGSGGVFRDKKYLESDVFNIKEEVEEEQCYTPINEFYNHNNIQKPADIVDDSFIECDYDDYMEEKSSLSEN